MKIAILSDIHENFHNLLLAFEEVEKEGCEQMLFLGDFINNGIAKFLTTSKIPVFAIWGNNDGDKSTITKTSLSQHSNLIISDGVYDFVKLGEKNIFLTHYPDIAKSMAKSGDYDAVFFGHNHEKSIEKIGNCILANPGEISAHKTGKATFMIYDTVKNEVEIKELKNSVTLLTQKVKEYSQKIDFKFSKSKRHQL